MANMSTIHKYKIIIEEFNKNLNKKLSAYDDILKERLNLSPRQIDRLLEELSYEFDNIIVEKVNKKKIYHLIKPIDLFVEAFDKSEDIAWLFNMAHEGDPEVFKELEQFTNSSQHIYKFKNTPFEDIKSLEEKDIFKKLKRAIKNREYAKITFKYSDNVFDNLKCLKLLFIDNNWYLAYIGNEDKLRLGRMSFIKKVEYATKINSYQPSTVEKQIQFLDTKLQNAMTLYDTEQKIATLKASGFITRYFEEGMKKFLSSQKYQKRLDDDGSIIFTVKYTQDIEILPFIQSWMPDLTIIEPQELKNSYLQKLQEATNNLN